MRIQGGADGAVGDTDVPVNLLWTGGWDSTFELLQLLLRHRRHVQPYYLQDPGRASTRVELETMERIRERLFALYPHTRASLRPLRPFSIDGLVADPAITNAAKAIVQRRFMGSQYDWLARFCAQNGIDDMELCIHRDDKAHAVVEPFVYEHRDPDGRPSWRLDRRHRGVDEYTVFGRFSFPLFATSKLEMEAVAAAEGWQELMDMTWFCHTPAGGKPCGICAPCLYTIEEGLGRRIPRSRRVLSFFYRMFILPVKPMLKKLAGR